MRNVHLSAINASHTIRIGFDAQRTVCTISFYRLCSLVCVCAVCVCVYALSNFLSNSVSFDWLAACCMGFLFVQLFNLFSIIQFECIYIVCKYFSKHPVQKWVCKFFTTCVCVCSFKFFIEFSVLWLAGCMGFLFVQLFNLFLIIQFECIFIVSKYFSKHPVQN